MKWKIIILAATFVVTLSPKSYAYFFWKKCIVNDHTFYHRIINSDNIEIGNSDQRAVASVQCVGTSRRHGFSENDDGVDLISDDDVFIPDYKKKICQGDNIYIQGGECYILFLKKEG
ncbi:MAG: hypothetical protein OEM02_14970 [Desulfobulbaceae bacterium]|nr:hypothetical protein [Desulfobulbaceae bacterium]